MFKKIFLTLGLFVFLTSTVFVPAIQAQQSSSVGGDWYDQSFNQWWEKVYDSPPNEIFGERYTAAQVQWIIYGLFAFILRSSTGNTEFITCLITNDIENCKNSAEDFFGDANSYQNVSNPIGFKEFMFTDRPLSGITYVKNVLRKYSIVQPVNAQTPGFGFQALDPILPMWRAVRNIAYSFIVIFSVVLAFMIMFRVKISPQVVIGVQSVIPKIIFAMILITFSYAIAGFLIDLMYVVIGIVSIMGKGFLPISSTSIFNFLIKGQPGGIDLQIGIIGLSIIYLMLFTALFLVTLLFNFGAIGVGVGILAGITGILPLLAILLLIVLIIIILVIIVKTLWALVKALANILLLTIFAPLQISLGVVMPNAGFSSWLRSYVSNLSVFVVTGFLYLLAFVFLIQGFGMAGKELLGDNILETLLNLVFGPIVTSGWESILTVQSWNSWPPLLGFGTSGVSILFMAVSFVMFTLTPKATDLIKSVIEGKPFPYGTAIGESLKPIGALAPYYGQDTASRLAGGQPPRFLGRIKSVRKYVSNIDQITKDKIANFLNLFSSGGRKY